MSVTRANPNRSESPIVVEIINVCNSCSIRFETEDDSVTICLTDDQLASVFEQFAQEIG